jgi:uncharacterized membrane protein
MASSTRAPFPPWPAFAVLGCGAAYLAARWDDIPGRWVVHWNAAGLANGWAARTAPAVFGPLVLAAGLLVLLESLTAIVSRRGGDDVPTEPVRAATTHFMRMVMLALSMVLTLLAIDLPLGPPLPPPAVALACLAIVVTAVALGSARVKAAHRAVRAGGDGAKVRGYHGLYYSDADDERLWVPKRNGLGLTINFAHRWAWPAMILVTGIPIALVTVCATQCH